MQEFLEEEIRIKQNSDRLIDTEVSEEPDRTQSEIYKELMKQPDKDQLSFS